MEKRLVDLSEEAKEQLPEGKRGIKRFSIVSDPAIKVKGYFFSSQEKKQEIKYDYPNMRLAAPAMIPMEIPRAKDEDDPDRILVFTEESLNQIFEETMSNFSNIESVNDDHTENIVPAYIREIWQVQDPELDRSFVEFGIKLPKGSIFVIIQFTDREYFEEVVREGKAGVSVEAFFIEKKYKFKNDNVKKTKKKMFKAYRFNEQGKKEEGSEVVLVSESDKIEEKQQVEVIDEFGEKSNDFTGQLETENGEVLIITDGKVDEIETPAELEDEEKNKEPEEPKKFNKEGKKKRFSMETETGTDEAGSEVTLVTNEDSLIEGVSVLVIDESLNVSEEYTGKLTEGDTVVNIESGVITSIAKKEEFEVEGGTGIEEDRVREIVKEETNAILEEIGKLKKMITEEEEEVNPENFSSQERPNFWGKKNSK